MKRGEIYLVNFGKVRPALIIQNDIANRNIEKIAFKGVTIIPLTSIICGGNLRVNLQPRENLQKESEICVNELCTLDLSRIDLEHLLTSLSDDELKEVEHKLLAHLGV